MLLEAIPAIYRAPLRGLERYLAVLAAVRALCLVHLAGTTKAPSPPVSSVSELHVAHSLLFDIALENNVRLLRSSFGAALAEPPSSMVCRKAYYFSSM